LQFEIRSQRERSINQSQFLFSAQLIHRNSLHRDFSRKRQLKGALNFNKLDQSSQPLMDQMAATKTADGLKKGVEVVKPDKHVDLLRPSARYYSASKDGPDREKGKYSFIRNPEDFQVGIYDKPLPCFGCGIGWFSFLLGFVCPLMWYYATILYFGNYYRKDPRERAGLAASAIAAMACSVVVLIVGAFLYFTSSSLA
jgi:hypothetical protein